QQHQLLRRFSRHLEKEGFRYVFKLNSPEEIENAVLERQLLWNNKQSDHGPFDIIGDLHGCFDELLKLLVDLGYRFEPSDVPAGYNVSHPQGRKAVFVGDLVDRGPKTPQVLRLIMDMVERGSALCVAGNHDMKLQRKLNGKDVQI